MKGIISWFLVVWLVHMPPSQASSSPPEPFPRGGAIASKANKRGRKLPRQNLSASTDHMFHPTSHPSIPSTEPIGTTSSSSASSSLSSSSSYAVEILSPYAPIDTAIDTASEHQNEPSTELAPSDATEQEQHGLTIEQDQPGFAATEKDQPGFVESMCRPDPGRFALFPIKNTRMWDMYKKHVASFW